LKHVFKYIFFTIAAIFIAAICFLAYDYFQSQEKFPPLTFIGRVNVGGLEQQQAIEKINRLGLAQAFYPTISFEADGAYYMFSAEAIGLSLNADQAVANAYRLTHNESYLKNLKDRFAKGGKTVCPVILNINDELLTAVIEGIAAEIKTSSQDASVVLFEESGGYHIEKEVIGRDIDVAQTLADVKQGLQSGAQLFSVKVIKSPPRITESMLRPHPPVYRLSAYTTYYGRHDSPNRIHNIKLIASWLKGTVLLSGETLSLANAIGDFTEERGFKEAFVIYNGVLVPQLGGGTCQIGTTLYNAVSLADLKINQRSNHSFYFNIYPLGRDATVYPGQKDFVFTNNSPFPVLVDAVATNKRLSFRIYGTPSGKKVTFSYPKVFMLTDAGYRPASVRQVLDADSPFKTIITRTVFDAAGKKIKDEKIYSFYKLYGEKSNVPIARPESR